MRFLLTATLVFFCLSEAFSQSLTLAIPDSVLKESNVVVLNDETIFTIERLDKSSLKRNYEVVILNRYAESKKDIILYYDNFTSIKNAAVYLLSANGKMIKKYKLKDFQDWDASGSNLASDARAKLLEINHEQYPFKLQVEYEYEYSGTMFYPTWHPQTSEKEYISKASFKIYNKSGNTFRYRLVNIDEPVKSMVEGAEVYSWEVNKLNPIEIEDYNYYIDSYVPIVYTAPNKFIMDGYEGDLSTWNSYGHWINKLNEGKNNLTEEQLSEIKALVTTADTDLEKVKKIYDYLQEKTRYVSIQLGIGGWQPFDASFVHEKKYGDCKALSFYTKTLLEAVGIKSYYTLIRAGSYEPDMQEDFPYSHFNHVIVTVPMKQDTIWLECTSQTNPFGYLGMFTSGRKALMITEEGGKVIETKDYSEYDNVQTTKGVIEIKKDGSAQAMITRSYKGIELQNDNFQYMLLQPKPEQDKWFYDQLDWGTFSVTDYSLQEIEDVILPSAGFKINLVLKNAGVATSNRLFFKPAVFTDISYIELNEEEREKDIYIRYPYSQYDSIKITPPENFYIENNLKDVELDIPYGSYSRRIIKNDGEFIYIRRFQIKKGIYPPSEYTEFKNFIRDVQKMDRQKLVFVDKT